MRNISDVIEAYLRKKIDQSHNELVEIRRSELAERFACVPSQINYVISTRFTAEKGYIVESKRGGGGYIRIIKVIPSDQFELLEQLYNLIGKHIDQVTGENIVLRLYDEKVTTKRETDLMLSVLDRSIINLNLPYRDEFRARILKAMITELQYIESNEMEEK